MVSIVVDFDALEHRSAGWLSCDKAFPIDCLDLEAVAQAFRRRVGATVTLLACAAQLGCCRAVGADIARSTNALRE